MRPDTIRRELLKEELMLNENISMFDGYDNDKSWEEEIINNTLDDYFNNEITFHEWQSVHKDLREDYL